MLPNPDFWQGKRVFITGHTGFKGSWAAFWLRALGAKLYGYALPPEDEENSFTLLNIAECCEESTYADINDTAALRAALEKAKPDIVIHMAAQSLVRRSYADPFGTYATNVMGTLNLLEEVTPYKPKVILVITSDKVYRNDNSGEAFKEDAPLGGDDPYSASKAACEIAVASWQASYLRDSDIRLATARGGNVIGGGDWAEDRLLPDVVRAIRKQEPVTLRYPDATRPWQHVLDVLAAYFVYIEWLGENSSTSTLNFGPPEHEQLSVGEAVDIMQQAMDYAKPWQHEGEQAMPEKRSLAIDTSQSRELLGFSPRYSMKEAVQKTAEWYQAWLRGKDMLAFSQKQLEDYSHG